MDRPAFHGALTAVFLLSCAGARPIPESSTGAQSPAEAVTDRDLRLLERADQILADASRWDRTDDRTCSPNAVQFSLFCALQKASIEVLGEYQHRRLALEEVRFAIVGVYGGRKFAHRLMDFNNLEETSFADIKKVLAIAHDRVAARLAARPP
jgi:hypothetical protein